MQSLVKHGQCEHRATADTLPPAPHLWTTCHGHCQGNTAQGGPSAGPVGPRGPMLGHRPSGLVRLREDTSQLRAPGEVCSSVCELRLTPSTSQDWKGLEIKVGSTVPGMHVVGAQLYRLTCAPLILCVGILNLSCDLIWRQGHYRSN